MIGKCTNLQAVPRLLGAYSIPFIRANLALSFVICACVSLGVAAVVASGTLVDSAILSLEATWRAPSLSGDYRLSNGFSGVPERSLNVLRSIPEVDEVLPVVSGHVSIQLDGDILRVPVLGIDLVGSKRTSLFVGNELSAFAESQILANPGALIISEDLSRSLGLEVGSVFKVRAPIGNKDMTVVSTALDEADIPPSVMLMDIFSAQVLFRKEGKYDYIEIISEEDVLVSAGTLHDAVRNYGHIFESGGAKEEFGPMASSVRMVLSVAGALSLVVGGVVIFHAVSMASNRRASQIGTIMSLGASRAAISVWLATESLVLGLAGTAAGTLLGVAFARMSARTFQSAVESLYSPIVGSVVDVSWRYAAFAAVLCVGLSLLANASPLRENIRRIASTAEVRSSRAKTLGIIGAASIAVGCMAHIAHWNLRAPEFLAVAAVVRDSLILLGSGLILPLVILGVGRRFWSVGNPHRMLKTKVALQGMTMDVGRTAAVLTAIMIGSAYVVISASVVTSIRHAVLRWIDQPGGWDISVTSGGTAGFFPSSGKLSPHLGDWIMSHPSVESVDTLQLAAQPFEDRWVTVAARDFSQWKITEPTLVVGGDFDAAVRFIDRGSGAIVSAHFAERHSVSIGSVLTLKAPAGFVRRTVEAIVVDYTGADLGAIFVPREIYESNWLDPGINEFRVRISANTDPQNVAREIQWILGNNCGCVVQTAVEASSRGLAVVDSVFFAAYALEAVAVAVLFISVVSFYFVTMYERRIQTESLRIVGASRRQVLSMYAVESSILGLLGGAIGSGIGVGLAALMVWSTVSIGSGMRLALVLPEALVISTIVTSVILSVGSASVPVIRHCSDTAPLARP